MLRHFTLRTVPVLFAIAASLLAGACGQADDNTLDDQASGQGADPTKDKNPASKCPQPATYKGKCEQRKMYYSLGGQCCVYASPCAVPAKVKSGWESEDSCTNIPACPKPVAYKGVCAQVMTYYSFNGQCCAYPTPCSVPPNVKSAGKSVASCSNKPEKEPPKCLAPVAFKGVCTAEMKYYSYNGQCCAYPNPCSVPEKIKSTWTPVQGCNKETKPVLRECPKPVTSKEACMAQVTHYSLDGLCCTYPTPCSVPANVKSAGKSVASCPATKR